MKEESITKTMRTIAPLIKKSCLKCKKARVKIHLGSIFNGLDWRQEDQKIWISLIKSIPQPRSQLVLDFKNTDHSRVL